MRLLLIALALFNLQISLTAQKVTVSGKIFDEQSREPLIAATIRVGNDGTGTITNADGVFSIDLTPGKYLFIFSYVGYKTDSTWVSATKNLTIEKAMKSGDVLLPEILVSANEDPAMAIMRMAIKNKKENLKGLISYEFDAYVKQIMKSGDELASVEESFLKGYKETRKPVKEFVKSVKKTENMKNNNRAPTGINIVDFTDEVVDLNQTKVKLPLANDAFDFYTYKLISTITTGNESSYKIQVIPKSRITPLFQGHLMINAADYTLIGVELANSEGFTIPFLDNLKIYFRQVYSSYSGYWIPQHSEFRFAAEINVGGLITLSEIGMNQTYTLTTCKVNSDIPESVRKAQRSVYGGYTTDTTATKSNKPLRTKRTKKTINPEKIAVKPAKAPDTLSVVALEELRPIPLSNEELLAYKELDSTKSFGKMVKVGGVLGSTVKIDDGNSKEEDGWFSKMMTYAVRFGSFRNNRVEGPYLGVSAEFDSLNYDYFTNGDLGYSVGLNDVFGRVGFGYNLLDDHLDRIDINIYRTVNPWNQPTVNSVAANTIGYTLLSADNFNYHLKSGINFGWHKYWTDSLYIKTYLTNENRKNLTTTKDYGIFNSKLTDRPNPASTEGNDRRLSMEFGWGANPFAFSADVRSGLFASAEISPTWLGSDYDYQRIFVSGQVRIPTLYSSLFFAPYLLAKVDAAYSGGKHEAFNLFTPDAGIDVFAPFGTMRGLSPYELTGNKMVSVQLEHNWRSVPFLAVYMNFMRDYDLITGFNYAYVNNETSLLNNPFSDQTYWETNIGISRIIAFLRFDATYNSRKEWFFTFSIASFL